jgi:hypothetical protein
MVNKEDIEALMLKYFPKCPLCSADKGYEVSGLAKNYVQCKSCGAKWESTDFIKCKELQKMQLWVPPSDGKLTSLKLKKLPIQFWQTPAAIESAIKTEEAEKQVKEVEREKKTAKLDSSKGPLISETMTDEEIRQKLYEEIAYLSTHQFGGLGMGLATFLVGMPLDQLTLYGFKALVEQNRIIIMQNELLQRILRRLLEAPQNREKS